MAKIAAGLVQPLRLWELAGADPARVFSPYVWRVRLVLAHKGIDYESTVWRYNDKRLIAPAQKVPVLDVKDLRLAESRDISQYIEDKHPDKPVFSSCQAGATSLDFLISWADCVMNPALMPIIILDVFNQLAPQDKAYFRTSREQRFGKPLEQICTDIPAEVEQFRHVMEPVRQTLSKHKWLGGREPNYGDIAIAGNFLWARAVSQHNLLEESDAIYAWRQRMFDRYAVAIEGTSGYDL
ncbi:hypothetical protein WJX74_006406 [Apatococcus lobatus]|uniref:Glutathione S-transferase n=1 Tax=Apatococcus lobatus TaxID=904363 RepID=A0AAW1QZR2_9CHLO